MDRLNLILIHRGPEYQRDFEEIAEKVFARDPAITVYCVPVQMTAPLPESAWERPALTVALTSAFGTVIRRGPILRNQAIDKFTQAAMARAAGIATPPALPFRPGMKLDPILFGDYVIIKPMSLTSSGEGIQLFRRRRLEQMRLADFPKSHLIHRDAEGYIVQRFIDTGEHPAWNRVITFFGEPIYAVEGKLTTPRPPLEASDEVLASANIAIQSAERRRAWHALPDVLDMARAVGRAFAEVPLLAIDMLREAKTGRLHFIECNPGGNTWHFSSRQSGGINLRLELGEADKHGEEAALELGRQRMIAQFGAFDVIARVLVEKTRQLAA
ncbi:hypothetical protein [Aestuariivirga sp.]|uniref:hypothetical protein n=1 Tax=Aestuariivirga sp. TaxID=2650926 RepID=UPI0039199BC9